jgi:hypothetical protein
MGKRGRAEDKGKEEDDDLIGISVFIYFDSFRLSIPLGFSVYQEALTE